ncbi:MAG TPA: hypothetical protein IGS17_13165 [Oscillatoriales cyanobacterium M59_W2019_021]|nr:hypothetical protein [Oscillatoriales cyanobacterium M4454_W2019_049]HIK51854.1 hypothetical protein [Oscillatoriales cyanobacterium M59_W2019_021]
MSRRRRFLRWLDLQPSLRERTAAIAVGFLSASPDLQASCSDDLDLRITTRSYNDL